MELFYSYRYEIFFVSGACFFVTTSLLTIFNYIKDRKTLRSFLGSPVPSSILNKNVVDTLKVRSKKKNVEPRRRKPQERTSTMDSPKEFYDQFDSMPLELIHQQLKQTEGLTAEVLDDEVSMEAFVERELTEEERDAMKIALEMDDEVKASKGVS